MSRWILSICLVTSAIASGGCSMCCGPYDYEYPMLDSSRYIRTDPEYGRVGSIFSDPNVSIGPAALTNEDVPREPEEPIEDIGDEDEDDPDFNMDTDSDLDTDSTQPDLTPDDVETIDTSAQRQRIPTRRRAWR